MKWSNTQTILFRVLPNTQNKSSFQRRLGPCLDKRCKPIDEKLIFLFFFLSLLYLSYSGTVRKTRMRERLIVTKFSTSLKNEQQQTKRKRNDEGKYKTKTRWYNRGKTKNSIYIYFSFLL
jgi:hypothetical protein